MTTPLRISVLGLNYVPEHTGIAPYTSGLAMGLTQRDFSVHTFAAHPHYPDWAVSEGYGAWTSHEQLRGVPLTRFRHYVPSDPRGVRRLASEITFGLRLLFASFDRPDVILAVSPSLFSTAIAAMGIRRGTPFVVWVQDIYSLGVKETGGSRAVASIVEKVESWLLRRADRVVVIHERFADYLCASLGVPRERIEVIRNWTHLRESALPDRAATRAQFGWSSDETVVLHAGNMGVKQGLENVIDAARIADERAARVRFVLMGNGSERDSLAALAMNVKRVEIIPSQEDELFAAMLDAADVLLVNEKPGVSGMAVPSKLTSYFSAARPVLAATDLGGTTASELNAASAGVIVNAGEPEALFEAAMELASDVERRHHLGRNGRLYRETVLTAETAIEKFATLLTRLSNAGARRGKSSLKYPVGRAS
ncbi:glycosyltransferase family 4 protein [Nesterenkonia sp. LB17]|uniref:glycosyltransferase family 4 protein n=1 Tax=Nesterenkonia sp. LB17 TaxID=2901230 RepID=UPI001F4CC511|nr:glycosyltransferase family 4 protein [Nesterenkonia sp. LB17]MCH8564900.1 glycosyltransferase family 4 protein [Nesterenkonia sp. LB17]